MIQVSSEFKKAIKEPERKIKGYVEVLYDLPSIEITPTSSVTSSYTDINDMLEGNRVKQNYGTVDYLPLDGSMLTMDDTTNDNSGFISDYVVEHYFTPRDNYLYLTLSFEETTIKGLTIYLRDNAIKEYSYSLSDGTVEYKTLDDYESQIQIIFDSPKTITSVQLGLGDFEYIQRKLKIDRIDLGISSVYKDQDLIDFTIDEEVNKLVEEVPINETNITLNNMNDLFNPLNPTGIVPYLSENTLIKPYIGVLTENNGIEYVKMGEFYFESYTNNSDATTTLVGKSVIKQLETQELIDDNEEPFILTLMTEQNFNDYIANYDYNIENNSWSRDVSTLYCKENNLLKFLKDMAFYQDNLLSCDRDSKIKIYEQNINIQDTLTKSELINDVEFKYIDKINVIKVKRPYSITEENVTSREILREKVELKNNTQVFAFIVSSPIMLGASVTQTGGTSATLLSSGPYMAFIKVVGTAGTDVEIVINSQRNASESFTEYLIKQSESKKDVVLEFDSFVNFFATSNLGYINNTNILERTPSYEMSFDYNGDPSLEAGDYINVETPYGYKKLFIQKNRFKFDGGLEGSIEGVE